MTHLFARLQDWMNTATLAGTSFCDACGQVCTPHCRREAQLDRNRQASYRNGLVHF